MWHVSSRSGVTTLRTAIHLLLTYLLTYARVLIVSETHVGDVGDAEQRHERKYADDSDMHADRPNTPATTTLYCLLSIY